MVKNIIAYMLAVLFGLGCIAFLVMVGYGIYNDIYQKGYNQALSEIDESWKLAYNPNHLEYENGFVILAELPYRGTIVFSYPIDIDKKYIMEVSAYRRDNIPYALGEPTPYNWQ